MDKPEKKKVLVVGGGFAGLNFIDNLSTKFFKVMLIDKLNHHQFQPLFYQVATAQVEPSSISFPFRYLFRNKKEVRIRLAKVTFVDVKKKLIQTTIGDFEYDYLILSMGCKTNFFGNQQISQHALTLKSTYDSIDISNHILEVFEKVTYANEEERKGLLNIVVVGAGPTGVELAGSFAEIKKNILPGDFHRIDFSTLRIILIEGSDHTLNNMSKHSHHHSQKFLEKLGVEILTNTFVVSYDGETLTTNNGEKIKTKTLIWAAGVIANTLPGIPESSVTVGNRLKVDRLNKLENCEDIFVIGDMAYMETPNYPKGHPQVANVAINQGKNLAKNLLKMIQGKPTKDYTYTDLGSMATIGKNKAVVDLPFIKLKGFFAWVIWMFLHLMLILTVRNKIIIFVNWTWTYFTKNTALRLIIKKHHKRDQE